MTAPTMIWLLYVLSYGASGTHIEQLSHEFVSRAECVSAGDFLVKSAARVQASGTGAGERRHAGDGLSQRDEGTAVVGVKSTKRLSRAEAEAKWVDLRLECTDPRPLFEAQVRLMRNVDLEDECESMNDLTRGGEGFENYSIVNDGEEDSITGRF